MDAKKVTYGKPKIGGAIYRAPIGTALPKNATEALNAAFKPLGYVSDDGLTNASSLESDKIKAWGGDVILYVNKGKEDTFKFKLVESLNIEVLKAVYGEDNVTGSFEDGLTIKVNSKSAESGSWVVDMVLKDGAAKRIVIPEAELTGLEDITYKDDSAIGYGITLSAVADEDGNTHTEYIVKKSAD